MDPLSLTLSAAALAVSTVALRLSLQRGREDAAGRALSRFSRFNEVQFAHPELCDVFTKKFAQIKERHGPGDNYARAYSFIWYVLNQMEGVYMDVHRGSLSRESFECYDAWMLDTLGKGTAVREFLVQRDRRQLQFFAKPYQAYLRNALAATEGGVPRQSLSSG